MKKILSLILCVLFLNLMVYPAAFADIETQPAAEEQTETSCEDFTQSSTDNTNGTTAEISDQNQGNNVVEQQDAERTEHLTLRKNNSKKITVESVYVSSHDVMIPAEDILQIAFVNDFNGRKARVGDTIEFRFPSDIVTQEGTVIIPATTRIIAEITKLKKPKPLHLSGKVYLNFKYIQLVDGTRKPIQAKLYGKKDFLSRKALNSAEAVGETVVTYGAGAATGALIGSSSANVAVIILGGSFGAGIGALAGIAVGILLPGASFKAKAGQRVNIQLTSELDI